MKKITKLVSSELEEDKLIGIELFKRTTPSTVSLLFLELVLSIVLSLLFIPLLFTIIHIIAEYKEHKKIKFVPLRGAMFLWKHNDNLYVEDYIGDNTGFWISPVAWFLVLVKIVLGEIKKFIWKKKY